MFGISLLEIIILSLLVYAISRFINRSRSIQSHLPVLLVVFGLLLAVPLVLATLFYARSSHSSPPEFAPPALPPNVWSNLDGQPFDASVFPSETAAAGPLARKVRGALEEHHLLTETEPTSAEQPETDEFGNADENNHDALPIAESELGAKQTRLTSPETLIVNAAAVNPETRQRFEKQLQSEFPISEIRYPEDPLRPDQPPGPVAVGVVRITLTSVKEHFQVTQNGHTFEQIEGQLICHLQTSRGSFQFNNNFISKPWVESFDAFVSSRPSQRFVVGYSGELASSADEARRRAMEDAESRSRIFVDGATIVMADESHVVDRFAQKLSRPYGDVWREAVLLDVSPERMQPLIAAARNTVVVVRQQRRSLAAALVILFGLTVVLCLALNFLTQGYYRNRLWISAAIVVGLGLLATLA
ncbi:MAG: hypothetical protein R3C59_11340 [Planctomycetaceae bacterium]